VQKSERRGHFKKGWSERNLPGRLTRPAIQGPADLVEQDCQLRARDRHPVNLNSLLNATEVRRREQTGSITGTIQNCGEHGRRGTFALAAGHMDDAQAVLWVTQSLQ